MPTMPNLSTQDIEEIEFIECSSLSINYDATGKVTISLGVLKNRPSDLRYTYTNRSWGGVSFDMIMMSAAQQAMIGSDGWYNWSLQMEGVGN
jgi:hypothetical protein